VERRFDPRPATARTEHDEAELIERTAAGDRRAFETLYRAYHPRLARFLQRMTRSAPLIEEIVNDTLLVVWRKAATFNGSSKVSTWIFAIAYRPDSQLAQLQLTGAVHAALAQLPLAQRTAFQLTFYHDMSYTEIAEIMECPVNTIKTRLFHARKRLAVLLEGQIEVRS
jgi:DNA-directed RNA polymerase specialized sigma24 family protein